MRVLPAFLCCVALLLPSSALAWSPLRAPNPNVEKGNALMAVKTTQRPCRHTTKRPGSFPPNEVFSSTEGSPCWPRI